jgi:dihydrofolate reductase
MAEKGASAVRLVVTEFMSLDGVVGDPGGAEGTEHGGWSLQFFGPKTAEYKLAELFASDAQLLGRVTYEGFAKAWPTMTDEQGFADRMNSLPRYVVSTTLDTVEWNNSHLISENVVDEIRKLKEQPGGDILVAGSVTLVQTLLEHDLIDELRLMVHPVVLGGGRRLFDGAPTKTLGLVETQTIADTGQVVLTYRSSP